MDPEPANDLGRVHELQGGAERISGLHAQRPADDTALEVHRQLLESIRPSGALRLTGRRETVPLRREEPCR